jgi:predicted DNA-binding transcriptional regulator AlpA
MRRPSSECPSLAVSHCPTLRGWDNGTGHRRVSATTPTEGMMSNAANVLSIEPRGLKRTQAAAYVGVSPSLFDEMVADGRMPQPKRINSRVVWDRKLLDEAFEALPDGEDLNVWDEDETA